MRAKQLRRGARPRLGQPEESDTHRHALGLVPLLTMGEVRRGLVLYDVPDPPRSGGGLR